MEPGSGPRLQEHQGWHEPVHQEQSEGARDGERGGGLGGLSCSRLEARAAVGSVLMGAPASAAVKA